MTVSTPERAVLELLDDPPLPAIAVFIDGDGIAPNDAVKVLEHLHSLGCVQIKRAYGNFSGKGVHTWNIAARKPDPLVTVLGGLVYAGDIVLAITGDKIDSGKITLLAERPLDELKQFKHVEAPNSRSTKASIRSTC